MRGFDTKALDLEKLCFKGVQKQPFLHCKYWGFMSEILSGFIGLLSDVKTFCF